MPFLIVFNLFFGWLFLKPAHWFLAEVILIGLFVLSSVFAARKISSVINKRDNVVDVEAQVLEDKNNKEEDNSDGI